MKKRKKYIHRIILLKSLPQLGIWFILCLVTLAIAILLERNNIIEFKIEDKSFISYMILISAVSGTIGAIMVGFIISRLQSLESERRFWYIELKHEIKELNEILHNLPNKYFKLCKPTDDCIKYLENIDIRTNLFSAKLNWKIIQKPSQIAFDDKKINTKDKDVYSLIQSIVHVEEYIKELQINWIASNIVGELLGNCSSKLFYVLSLSLVILAFFYISSETYIFNKYTFLLLITSATVYLVLIFLEIIVHTKDYVKEIISSDKGKMDNLELLT